ncbi:pyruvate dehydrogenase (acetyl-transferring), homodimeric type [Acidipila sp. EB88]|uniref:pyruvate dehydrogenase (acetyl-transferring), homodimeric type n=1 Tax=Acidipila sp. EB88 TaxID=2305226 RepID=UPI000F5E80B8|nr:pyruvate dehydrogenase (acetyl-transferring), homodimeric type [Acidipila sp. EB88]RRA47875.1 pyruvate dehydrogenase (acetyl-transferring), homodimeric type [Acidipila sp. EB88]
MATKTAVPVEAAFQSEIAEWIEAFDEVIVAEGAEQGATLMEALRKRAGEAGIQSPGELVTDYRNTIHKHEEVPYPGDRDLERRVESLIRWNAMAMVHGQNKKDAGIGGHIATYSSLATLLEVGFNHFFRAKYGEQPGDFIYFQGHASPGVYARAFLEGRFDEERLQHFRHELRGKPALSSYPHPWLMPDFWRFPTVSMGIGPLNAIYQARFMRYLENRSLIEKTPRKVWAFVGDGETDEVDTLGALTMASREKLDNLVFVVNCNLQRLDGPVRGNMRVIDELEGVFRGAGWNVLKVVWGSDWDKLFERDHSGLLLQRMEECVDGDYQAYKAKGGAYLREHFFGKYPELLELVADYTDDELIRLHRGGHDPAKIYNAYKRATEHVGGPTVILAKTVKGYGLGSTQARNASHQEKKLTDDGLLAFVKQFDLPLTDEQAKDAKPYKPAADAPEIVYMQQRRKELGGYLPARTVPARNFKAPELAFFGEWTAGSKGREVSTTMGFVSILRALMKDPNIGKLIVPIVPDEGRTFGLESAVRQVGIYASEGQKYKPHDADVMLYYREEQDGQILEEGITEAGSMASFTAAGTAYSNYNLPTIPFYMYYSMFGFQRVGDMIWAFADSRGKGFLMGGTAGRTTMLGEGLQHQDGHSHLLASTVPTCLSYDPAYVYELAVILQDGIRRMYAEGEDCFYYLTMYNEDYAMPAMPADVDGKSVQEGILRGIYRLQTAPATAQSSAPPKKGKGGPVAQLLGSGPILNEVLKAQAILAENYGVAADVWSVTSWNELRRDALEAERWNRLHPADAERQPYLLGALGDAKGPIVAASDYMKTLPDQLAPWLGGRLVTLGTDGFGRSDNREHLRRHFEVNAASIVAATLSKLARDGAFDKTRAQAAFAELGLDTEGTNPARM